MNNEFTEMVEQLEYECNNYLRHSSTDKMKKERMLLLLDTANQLVEKITARGIEEWYARQLKEEEEWRKKLLDTKALGGQHL